MEFFRITLWSLCFLQPLHSTIAIGPIKFQFMTPEYETQATAYGAACLLDTAKSYFFRSDRDNFQTIVVSHTEHLSVPGDFIQDTFLNMLNTEIVQNDDFVK